MFVVFISLIKTAIYASIVNSCSSTAKSPIIVT